MLKKLMLTLILLAGIDFSCAAMFKKGDRCRITFQNSKFLAMNEVVTIIGTSDECFNIPDLEELANNIVLYDDPALVHYFGTCVPQAASILAEKLGDQNASINHLIPQQYQGIFYIVKNEQTGDEGCVHASWVERIAP